MASKADDGGILVLILLGSAYVAVVTVWKTVELLSLFFSSLSFGLFMRALVMAVFILIFVWLFARTFKRPY
jgi:hypothetical protein